MRKDILYELARLMHEGLAGVAQASRLEDPPDTRALLRLGRALIEQYCASVLDVDDTFDRVHGGQQLRLFNAFHDDYGFQPIVVFDGDGPFVTALLHPASGRAVMRSVPFCAASGWRYPRLLAAGRSGTANLAGLTALAPIPRGE